MKTIGITLVRRLILVALVLIGLQLGLHAALGYGLKKGFSKGTGCIVALGSPRIDFFPLRGSVRNIHIYHADEPQDEGLFADALSIHLDFLALLSKKVLLSELKIENLRAISTAKETGFLNTLNFVIPSSKKPTPISKPSWHSFVTGGWSIGLTDVTVSTDENKTPNLVLANNNIKASWDGVFFQVKEISNKNVDTILSANAKQFKLQIDKQHVVNFGETELLSSVNKGILRVKKGSFRSLLPDKLTKQKSETTFSGEIQLNNQVDNAYNISVTSKIFPTYLSELIPLAKSQIENIQPKAAFEASITGPLLNPTTSGYAKISLDKPFGVIKRKECMPSYIAGNFSVNAQSLRLSELEIDSLTKNAFFELTLNEDRDFSMYLDLSLGPNNELVKNCLEVEIHKRVQRISGDDADFHWIDETLRNAIYDSLTKLKMKGALVPLSFKGTLFSETQTSDVSISSKLNAKFTFDEDVLKFQINERGSLPQIQKKPLRPLLANDEKSHTPFETAINSNIDAVIDYNVSNRKLTISKLDFLRYPARKFVARVSPFVKRSTLKLLHSFTSAESLIDSSFSFAYQPAEPLLTGAGQISISDITLAQARMNSLDLKVTLDNDNIRIPQFSLKSSYGEMHASGNITLSGNVKFDISAHKFALGELPDWQRIFPSYPILADVDMTVSGSLQNPLYNTRGSLYKLQNDNATDTIPELNSTFSIEGDANHLQADISLLQKRGTIELYYPISQTNQKDLELDAHFTEFPLDVFLVGEHADAQLGTITADLTYKGPRKAPLLGVGKLSVASFDLNLEEKQITHDQPLHASIRDGKLTFTDFEIKSEDSRVSLTGFVDHRSGWHANLETDWDLTNIGLPIPGIEHISGNTHAKLNIKGPFDSPLIDGPLKISNATLSLPLGNSIVGATDIDIDAIFSNKTLNIDKFTGRMGQGYVFGIGRISNIIDIANSNIGLHFKFSDIYLEPIEKFSVEGGGILHITKPPQEALWLKGNFTLNNALYENTIDLATIIKSITQTVTGNYVIEQDISSKSPKADTNIQLDISIAADNALLIETDFAQLEMRSNMHVLGQLNQPRFQGEVEALDGNFGFKSNKFQIITAKLAFPENSTGFNPEVDIVGETTISTTSGEEYQVQLSIGGTASNPIIQFSSDSGLAENDIVSLLAFGGRSEELSLLQVKSHSSRLSYAELLDPKSEMTFGERISGLTGFREIQIDSRSSASTGEFVPIITAKRAVLDKLDLILKSELGTEQVNSAGLDYNLTPYLSFITGWRSVAVTAPDSSTGNLYVGLRYRKTFPGLTLFPPQ